MKYITIYTFNNCRNTLKLIQSFLKFPNQLLKESIPRLILTDLLQTRCILLAQLTILRTRSLLHLLTNKPNKIAVDSIKDQENKEPEEGKMRQMHSPIGKK